MTQANFTSTTSLRRVLCTLNPALNGLIVTIEDRVVDVELGTDYYLVRTGVGSGTYRACADELHDLEPSGEPCSLCGGMNLIRTGKCFTCADCGEPGSCS